MKQCGRVEVNVHLSTRWYVVSFTPQPLSHFTLGAQCIRDWLAHRYGLDIMERRVISCPNRQSGPDFSIVQLIATLHALLLLALCNNRQVFNCFSRCARLSAVRVLLAVSSECGRNQSPQTPVSVKSITGDFDVLPASVRHQLQRRVWTTESTCPLTSGRLHTARAINEFHGAVYFLRGTLAQMVKTLASAYLTARFIATSARLCWHVSSSGCNMYYNNDRLCGPVGRMPGYRYRDPDSILGATRFSEK
jgi:hypothetical protein